MDYFLLQAHSGWRFIVILLVVATAIKMLIGWLGKQNWRSIDTNLLLASRGAIYVQVLLGVILYILLQKWTNMRFTAEHTIILLLAVGGVEFASARAKKAAGSAGKFRMAFIGLAVSFVLIFVGLQAVGGLFAMS
ncbi:MAG: DUF2165 family protein [Chloroflexi bacterium]|nr:MAG: DUF2165 family protein [Chloroflexota bacterium]